VAKSTRSLHLAGLAGRVVVSDLCIRPARSDA